MTQAKNLVVAKKHRYLGKWYAVGAKFKDKTHETWACDPVRNFGGEPKTEPAK